MSLDSKYIKHRNVDVKEFGRVAVLYGGNSAERGVSLESGNAVLQGLKKSGVDAFGVDINKNVFDQLSALNCDRAFVILHGPGGEDGKVQAILEARGIPYTGSGIAASSLAMDKLRTKLALRGADLPTPEFEVLKDGMNYRSVLQRLGGECFVKPVREGSSIGMSLVVDDDALQSAHRKASNYDDCVIAEARIIGKEFTVAVLHGQALPAIELKANNDFYDYDAKYLSDETVYLCPCLLAVSELERLYALAIDAYETVGCKTWGRVDFMQDQEGIFYLLEVNTIPGMTSHSLVPMAAKEAGLSFEELLLEILSGTLEESAL